MVLGAAGAGLLHLLGPRAQAVRGRRRCCHRTANILAHSAADSTTSARSSGCRFADAVLFVYEVRVVWHDDDENDDNDSPDSLARLQ